MKLCKISEIMKNFGNISEIFMKNFWKNFLKKFLKDLWNIMKIFRKRHVIKFFILDIKIFKKLENLMP